MMDSVLVDIGMLIIQFFVAAFLLYWAAYTILVLAAIILENAPETYREGFGVALREMPLAMLIAFLIIVVPNPPNPKASIEKAEEDLFG